MKILMITSEMDGIIKTGGLADFAAALPKALINLGHEVRIIMPKYKNGIFPVPSISDSLYFNLNHKDSYGSLVHHIQSDNIPVMLVEHHDFFSRDGIYDDGTYAYPDNPLRYAFLCKAALEYCLHEKWIPDIIHGNDWHTALAPYYLKEHYHHRPELKNTKTVLTIHNGEHQGKAGKEWLEPLGIPPWHFTSDIIEEYGILNLLKCGIMYADAINAVSHGYYGELLQPDTSHDNLWQYLHKRQSSFSGILNGCDYTMWNPASDKYIPYHFSAQVMRGKEFCKKALQRRMGLPENKNLPVFGLVARLSKQKGFDYLIPALERLLYERPPLQLAMLGSGEAHYASRLHYLQQHHPGTMSFVNGYDNELSHLIEAGADFFIMPSLFEPCGLNQLYSMAYGTLPVIRETGGLKDTVNILEKGHGNIDKATGIGFKNPDNESCYECLKQAVSLYLHNKDLYRQIQQQAMMQKFTWEDSAKGYESLYYQTVNS
ncbi:Glycogen synthase [Desulfamplus magnetovallimortis]|uniref:Glycogen synthase n=1 Tax=Desulfamplus magnetovallimortis TaxID=1246637 RepID=A0A1W1HJG1_9BACT|nr:glycogen synthase [Desulfamplus magnetovallimortis]SLM32641.1 Glycogen synthase [Desulfamplus magnetovallimortis]